MTSLVLRDGVTVGGKTVRTFTLREPTGADLRGISLSELIGGSTAASARLIPRIATPPITAAQVELLPMIDQAAIVRALMDFLLDGGESSAAD